MRNIFRSEASNYKNKYALDSSGILHMASMNKRYTNTFRISVRLKEKVDPKILQQAFQNISPRFPTIVAGIKKGWFQYFVVPAEKIPKVKKDKKYLSTMSGSMIKNCAMQVLYKDETISVEIFHSLTDGIGGTIFVNSLVAEYLSLRYSLRVPYSDNVFNPVDEVPVEELTDGYLEYLGDKPSRAKPEYSYKIPGDDYYSNDSFVVSKDYSTKEMVELAHYYGVSLTTLLTVVMVKSIAQVQEKKKNSGKAIKIMIPVNLRNKFESKTLYNFTIYALPRINADKCKMEFEQLINNLSEQLKKQFSKEHLQREFTKNVNAQNYWWFKILPVSMKAIVLKQVYRVFGEKNASISISNFGEVRLPDEIKKYIHSFECALTPRTHSPYNCGVISYNGRLNICFSKKGDGCGFENVFFSNADQLKNAVIN